jgi:hypothetical protein
LRRLNAEVLAAARQLKPVTIKALLVRSGSEIGIEALLRGWPGTGSELEQGLDRQRGRPMAGQNSGSLAVAGARGRRRGGREGAPGWSVAWTAAATSCAVSASTAMFRRSSTRRTTCPACRGASCGSAAI